MRVREFPILGDEDERTVEAFATGLDREAARVLAYLVGREESDRFSGEAASRLAVRVGVDLGRGRVSDVLGTLTDLGLVVETTVDSEAPGRPPKGWRAAAGHDRTVSRVRARHSEALLDQAATVASTLGDDIAVDTTGPTPPDRDAGAVDVGLNWEPNGLHAPLFAGTYADHGVDVTLTGCRGSRAALSAVADGDVDVGLTGAATLLRAHAGGEDVVPLALYYQRAMVVLYTTRSAFGGPLRSVEDVRGRRVAMPAGSETGALGRLFLAQAGVVDDVTVVRADGEEREALLDGDADVATGVFTDPLELEAAGYDVDSVLLADHFPVPGPAFVVRRETLRERPDALRGFLEGAMAGWADARNDPEAAATTVAGHSDEPVADERRKLEGAFDRFAGGDAVEKNGWGWHSAETWERLRVALEQAAAIDQR
ncbi:ABC transporter substrate-binding protein [Haloplanus aerogenes]|uniref:ABC-type nitrate/sulfonate/bicarbonate transport system substrate-binding protein n=1 Tax=Haloplanus aerogenes TaxID=660522 RepID=A0A3M0CZU2_9EURY|nr:ABC transporter substrate-binding protein [Haloplanus aerogenes]AZH26744.1 myristoyl transferase [Haloplanus aerogenes]RMB12989.1 ABC-type nitrate/sulfonate/bicarbonate transport system substrate-binding protein [Haloplanus aerogenes]